MLMNLSKDALKGHSPHFFKNYFTFKSSVHNRITRQMNMLYLPRVRTDSAKTSLYYCGSVSFNRLNFSCFNILFMCTVTVYSPYFKINF